MEIDKDRDLDAFHQNDTTAEDRGGDHRPIQDNGTGGRGFNVQGENTIRDHPTIPNPIENPSEGTFYQFNQGLAGGEVGHDGNQMSYGVDGPSAGGGVEKNIKA